MLNDATASPGRQAKADVAGRSLRSSDEQTFLLCANVVGATSSEGFLFMTTISSLILRYVLRRSIWSVREVLLISDEERLAISLMSVGRFLHRYCSLA